MTDENDLTPGIVPRKRLEKCPVCGDHNAHEVRRLECNSCRCAMHVDWEIQPSTPIEKLLEEYAQECSDFSGQKGYEFAVILTKGYAERGPDSQLRCVVYTLLNPPKG